MRVDPTSRATGAATGKEIVLMNNDTPCVARGVVIISAPMKITATNDAMPDDADADEGSADLEKANRTQRPMEVSAANYVDLGAAQMVIGADGMPVLAGEPRPAGDGLSSSNFICAADQDTGRPPCQFYAAVLLTAEGTVKGFGKEQPRALRRFCTKLAAQSELMELTETDVFACTLRSPVDFVSAAVIATFESRQKHIAAAAAKTSDDFEI